MMKLHKLCKDFVSYLCHPEQCEGSLDNLFEIFHFVQNDNLVDYFTHHTFEL